MGKKLNLYLISQNVNDDGGIYDALVVCAETEDEARHFDPETCKFNLSETEGDKLLWCGAKDVKVKLIGIAIDGIQKGCVLSSYMAEYRS